MQQEFQFILNNYIDGSVKVDSSSPVYKKLVKELPKELTKLLGNRNDLIVKGSMGQGNKTSYPWISILNTSHTTTTMRGIYVVYLFKKDMSGFYLTLNQGITNFANLYHSKKYEYAQKVSNYYKQELQDSIFSKDDIHLGDGKKDMGYGYERTTILSKYYKSNNFTYESLKQDLLNMINCYDYVIKHLDTYKYDDVIKKVIGYEQSPFVKADVAIQEIKESIEESGESTQDLDKNLIEQLPLVDRSDKFKRITSPIVRKVDYFKKAKVDALNGEKGELLALKEETSRLTKLGRPDLADKVVRVSLISDSYGYDIISYDLDENGKEFEIKIEVKTTQSKIDTEFMISKNEVETSKKLKERYCLFRIYDLKSPQPKFYKMFGEIEKNFILDPVTYLAKLKIK